MVLVAGGLELVVPGNGFIYVSGHANTSFDKKRKYALQGDTLVEVKQPFYYVGLDSETFKEFTLYGDREAKQPVAVLPKGSKVKILLMEESLEPGDMPEYPRERFLLVTPYGLTGWIKVEVSQTDGQDSTDGWGTGLKGLFFAGD